MQCDGIWSFVYVKQKNVKEHTKDAAEIWTRIAFDSPSKLVISFFVGIETRRVQLLL